MATSLSARISNRRHCNNKSQVVRFPFRTQRQFSIHSPCCHHCPYLLRRRWDGTLHCSHPTGDPRTTARRVRCAYPKSTPVYRSSTKNGIRSIKYILSLSSSVASSPRTQTCCPSHWAPSRWPSHLQYVRESSATTGPTPRPIGRR